MQRPTAAAKRMRTRLVAAMMRMTARVGDMCRDYRCGFCPLWGEPELPPQLASAGTWREGYFRTARIKPEKSVVEEHPAEISESDAHESVRRIMPTAFDARPRGAEVQHLQSRIERTSRPVAHIDLIEVDGCEPRVGGGSGGVA